MPGYPDNPRRFAMLVRAALEFLARRGEGPCVVHAHDWQAGLAPVYLKTLYAAHPVLGGAPTVFTIHNLAYQGLFEPDWLPRLDLPGICSRRAAGVLGPHQFSEGRHQRRRRHHDGEPEDTPARSRRPSSGSASTASCGAAPAIWSAS